MSRPRRAPLLLLGVLPGLLTCAPKHGRPAPAPSASDTAPEPSERPAARTRPDAAQPDVAKPAAPAADDPAARAALVRTARAIERVLCPDPPCVTAVTEFGRDGKGQELLVVELNGEGGYLTTPPGVGTATTGKANDEGQAEPSDSETAAGASADECLAAEYHLVARKGRRIRPVALLAKSCNKAPDFPLPGDVVEVDKEERLVSQSWGGGNVIWTTSTVSMSVEPLRLVGFTTSTVSRADPEDETQQSWDWDQLAGTSMTSPVDCKAVGKAQRSSGKRVGQDSAAPEAGQPQGNESDGEGVPHFVVHAALIPIVTLPPGFIARGWRTTGLGSCAAGLDFTIHGGSDSDGDSRGRAVITDGPLLFVEVSDDRFVGPGKSWVTDDHLELWMAKGNEPQGGCDQAAGPGQTAQWGIRVADGAVFSAHGAPPPLKGVERVVTAGTARFKIPLPAGGIDRITVVYSDSDDGRVQKRLIATSELRFGVAASLGEGFPVDASYARCIVKGGGLTPIRVALQPPEYGALLHPP